MDPTPIAGTTFVMAEWRDDGQSSRQRPIAPLHRHEHEDEAWYVLEGRLGFRSGSDVVEVDAGDAFLVPAGTPHTYWNAGDGVTRYLIVMGPHTARLVEAIHELEDRSLEAVRAVFAAHDSELLA